MPFYLMIFLILLVFFFFLLEWKPLLKQRRWRDLAAALLFLIIAAGYGLDYFLDLNILPNPNLLLKLVKPVSDSFEKFFQLAG